MNKFEYLIKENESAIEQSLNKIAESVAKAQANVASGDFAHIDPTDWTDGYVARDVAQLTTLLARQHALYEALRIIKSNNLLNYLADL